MPVRVSVASLALTVSDGAALATIVIWGLNASVFKMVLTEVTGFSAIFLRSLLSAVFFVSVLIVTRQWRWPRRADVRTFLLVGLVGMAVNMVLFAEGLRHTTASHSGLISTTTPLLVFGVSHFLGELRISRRDLWGLALGFAGAVLIVGAPIVTGSAPGGPTLLGDGLSLASSLTWGAWVLAATPLLRRYGTLHTTAWLTTICTFGLTLPAAGDLGRHDWLHLGWLTLGGFAYIGIISGSLGSLLWYGAVRQLGAARTMVYANLQSFFVIGFAALLLGEHIEPTAVAGGLLVIGGVLLTRRRTAAPVSVAEQPEPSLDRRRA